MSKSVYGVAWREWSNEERVEVKECRKTFVTEAERDRFYRQVQDREKFCDFTDYWSETVETEKPRQLSLF